MWRRRHLDPWMLHSVRSCRAGLESSRREEDWTQHSPLLAGQRPLWTHPASCPAAGQMFLSGRGHSLLPSILPGKARGGPWQDPELKGSVNGPGVSPGRHREEGEAGETLPLLRGGRRRSAERLSEQRHHEERSVVPEPPAGSPVIC